MATPEGKKPNKQQINNAGNEVGLDLANAIGKAINRTLSNYDFSPLGKNITKTINSEVSKINPVKLQAKLTEMDTSIIDTLPQAQIKGTLAIDPAEIQSQLEKTPSVKLKATIGEVQQPKEDLFGPVEVNPKIGKLDFDADRLIDVVQKSFMRLNTTLSLIGATLRKEISSSPFDQMADGVGEVGTKSNKTGSELKKIGEQLTKLTGLLTKAFDSKIIDGASVSVSRMRRETTALSDNFNEAEANATSLLSAIEVGNSELALAKRYGSDQAKIQASIAGLKKEELIKLAETLSIQKAQELSAKQLKESISRQLIELDNQKEINRVLVESYESQGNTVGEIVRNTTALLQNQTNTKKVSQMLVADADRYANWMGQSGALTAEIAQLYGDLTKATKQELVIAAQKLKIADAEKLSKQELVGLVSDATIKLAEQSKIADNIVSSINDQDKAMKQVLADIKLKNVIMQTGLTGQYAETARLLELQKEQGVLSNQDYIKALERLKAEHHIYEEKAKQLELTESLANWQLQMNGELEEYEMGWEKIKSKIKAIITDPKLAKTVFAAEGIKTAIESVKKFGEGFEKMKEKGLSAGQAATAQMKTISTMSVLGLSDTQGVMEQVIESYGNVNALSRTQVDNIGQMAHHMGITGQEAMQVNATLSQMTGETTESAIEAMHFTENLAKANGVAPGKVMKDIAKNSAAVALYSKDGAKGFGKAAIELHKMGVEIGTAAKMADGLLDFENSINKQMEASVLLGREINLDKAREMALNGDLAGAAKETLANIGGAAEFTKMNVVQKRALAEAAGMTVEELQKALDAEEEQQKYHGEEAGFWMNTIGYVTEYGTKLGGFLKEHGVLLLSGLNTLAQQETRQFIINGLQKGYNILKGIGNGILLAGKAIFDSEAREKVILWTKEKAQWAAQKAHIGWLKLNAFFGSKKAKEKLANMAKDKLAGGVTDKAKDMATGKVKDLAGDKTKDLAGKATEGADKLGESGDKVGKKGMAASFKDNMKSIAEGFKEMGQGGVLKGIFNTMLAGPALVIALPAIPFLLFMGKVSLKQLEPNFKNLGEGLEKMSKTFTGSLALGVFAVAAIPSVASIPFLLFMGLVPLKQLQANFEGLGKGLQSMSKSFIGSLALGLFAIAGAAAVATLPFLLGISLLGKPAEIGLKALGMGLAAFGNPATALFVLIGIGLLAALGVAMIPFAAALAIATPAIKAFGDIIIGVFQQIPPIIAAVAAGFVTIFSALAANWQILIPVGIGLGAVAIGLGALGGAALFAFPGLILASIGLMAMMPGLIALNAIAQTDALPKLAQSFAMLAALGPGLLVFSISLGALGAAGLLAFPGLILAGAGLLTMVPGLMAVGAIAQTGSITALSQSLLGLGSAAGGLALVSASLFGIAGGLGAIALAGFAAMPIIGALAGLATVAPMLAGLGSLFGGGGGGEQQPAAQTKTTAAPAEDGKMDILISEIRSLKEIMSKGGVINMDGKKVGDVVRLAMNTSGVR